MHVKYTEREREREREREIVQHLMCWVSDALLACEVCSEQFNVEIR